MKKLHIIIIVIVFLSLNAQALFEVKDAGDNAVLEVSQDGLRIFNMGDTLMVISSSEIKAFVDDRAKDRGLSRSFSVSTNTTGKGSGGDLMKISNASTFETINDSTMLWYKQKNAFRVGYVLITDPNNVGQGSFASGYQSQASGRYSSAIGYKSSAENLNAFASGSESVASGANSFAIGTSSTASASNTFALGYEAEAINASACAIGYSPLASGSSSLAVGYKTEASGTQATAMGAFTVASNTYASAFGVFTDATGYGSTAMGLFSQATGDYSMAMGTSTYATGNYSTATGYYSTAQAFCSFVVGRYNIVEGNTGSWGNLDPLFVVGNGSGTSDRSNAFEVQKNGVIFCPSVYTSTSSYSRKDLYIDSRGKLCVLSKSDGPSDEEEIELLKQENAKLNSMQELQEERIKKLEALTAKLLK